MSDCQEPEYEELLEIKGEIEPVWITTYGQAVFDATAFVLYRVVDWRLGDPRWVVQAFPGPGGDFVFLADFKTRLKADRFLQSIYVALTP